MNKTTVVNIYRHDYDIFIGRFDPVIRKPCIWGNPFIIGKDGNRKEVIEKHLGYARMNREIMKRLPELAGKRLGCFCVKEPVDFIRENKVCHGENYLILLKELNLL